MNILFYCLNDINGHSAGQAPDYPKNDFFRHKYSGLSLCAKRINNAVQFNEFFIRRSKFYLLLKSLFLDVSKTWFLFDLRQYADKGNVDYAVESLGEMRDSLAREGVQFDVFAIPYEYQLRARKPVYLLPQAKLRSGLMLKGIALHDLYSGMAQRLDAGRIKSSRLFIFNDHCHLSRMGHRIAAEELLGLLKGDNGVLSVK